MNIQMVKITPEIAEQYLEKNKGNYRSINRSRVLAYAEDMASGNWVQNGEAIKFSENGMLIDGQHRLQAIIQSGKTIEMPVITGIDNDVSLFDIGGKRIGSQIAAKSGISEGARANAALAAAKYIVCGDFGSHASAKGKVIQYVKDNEAIIERAYRIVVLGTRNPIAKRAACLLAVIFLLKNAHSEERLMAFFNIVNSGFPEVGTDCSSAIVLRNYLIKEKTGRVRDTTESRKCLFSNTVSAFMDFCAGKHRQQEYRISRSILEDFERFRLAEIGGINDGN